MADPCRGLPQNCGVGLPHCRRFVRACWRHPRLRHLAGGVVMTDLPTITPRADAEARREFPQMFNRRPTLRDQRGRITPERLREAILYDPEAGLFTSRINRGRVSPGQPLGCLDHRDHRLIRIDGRLYRANRLAWLYMTGAWPVMDVDHINGDPSDDRWRNLRLATASQNIANSKISKNNTSGFKGVVKTEWGWRAEITHHRKKKHLGMFKTPEEAHGAYLMAAKHLFGEFARSK